MKCVGKIQKNVLMAEDSSLWDDLDETWGVKRGSEKGKGWRVELGMGMEMVVVELNERRRGRGG